MRSLLIGLLLLSGCKQMDTPPAPESSTADHAAIDEVSQRLDRLTERVNAQFGAAQLKLGDDGFSMIRTDVGGVTLQWTSAEKVGAGTRLTFRLGNPHSAKLNGLTIYGYLVKPDGGTLRALNGLALKGDVAAGRWSSVSGIVDEAAPDQFSKIHVSSMLVSGITLSE